MIQREFTIRASILHICLDYTGAITSEKLEQIKKKDAKTDYTTDDQVGISGLESVYEDYLKGKKVKKS